MTHEDYRAAFEQAKADFNKAFARQEVAELALNRARVEVIKLRRAVVALAALCGEEDVEREFGVTDAIRAIFSKERLGGLTLQEIKSEMESLGVVLSDLKNPLASIHSALTRLTAVGFLKASKRSPHKPGERIRFEWKRT